MVQTRKRRRLSKGDRVVAVSLAALVAATLVFGVLQRFHLSLIQGELNLILPLLAVFTLVAWGASALIRRIKRRGIRLAVGTLAAMALLLVAMIAFNYASLIAAYFLPHAYATMTSPSGRHKLVVMRRLDVDEDRSRARQAARLEAAAAEGEEAGDGAATESVVEPSAEEPSATAAEAGGEAASDANGEAERTLDDYGYIYTAYPLVARFFYRDDADVTGEAVIGYSSAATLMVEWAADESQARFYVQDPAVSDGGEVIVRLDGK